MKNEKKPTSKTTKRSAAVEESLDGAENKPVVSFPFSINIASIENVDPQFAATDVYVVVEHQKTVIGQTENTYVLDKTFVEINSDLIYCCNVSQPKELDKLITYPIHFMVWQTLNKLEYEKLEIAIVEPDLANDEILSSQELILGVKDNVPETPVLTKSLKTSVKSSAKSGGKKEKEKVVTKGSAKATVTTTRTSLSNVSLNIEDPTCIGSGTMDLLPFFKGETEITEIVPIHQKRMYIDERFKHASLCPQMKVTIKVTGPLFEFIDKNMVNMFQMSFEAMYNCPEEFTDGSEFKLATVYPMENLTLEQFYLENGLFKLGSDLVGQMKFWPNISTVDDLGSQTKQIIDSDLSTIKNKTHINLNELIDSNPSRVVWNSIKRSWLSLNANEYLKQMITRYRSWPIEIKMNSVKMSQSTPKLDKKKPDKKSNEASSPKDQGKKSKMVVNDAASNNHFMAYADISTLLYPGVTKTRVVCPLYNFCQPELTRHTGYDCSCFSQYAKMMAGAPDAVKEVEKDKKSPTKEEKSSKASKDKKGKKVKEAPIAEQKEETCESELVRNAAGICFIIIEAELTFPFMEQRTIEDLTEELMSIIPKRAPLPKSVIPMRVAVNLFKTTIFEMSREINKEFQHYSRELDHLKQKEVTTPCFIKYLQEKGTYQKFLLTIGQSISILVKEKFKYTEEQQTEYMYDVMKDNHRSSDHWFNLAVFYKGQKFFDRAYECCKEGLALKTDHKLCLLLFGGMLYEKQDYAHAETTLLTIVNYYPECLEAWVGLYIVYYHKTKFDGCDVCMEHINKYKAKVIQIDNISCSETSANVTKTHEEQFRMYEPLGWSTQIASKTPFFRCAVTFIKMQLLQFAEQSLLFDLVNQTGEHKYYLGVIKYFQREYSKALDVLYEAQKTHGPDYAVNSMIGHCNYRLGNFEEAKESYEFIVCAYNRPEDMHTLYTNLALIYEKENNLAVARKYLLFVCKMSPTPYSWLLLGIVFFKDDKLKEAEACVTESNNLDNRLPESWAYLVLINIKLEKIWEAQQCFSQMIKYDLQDKSLLALVVIEMNMAKKNST